MEELEVSVSNGSVGSLKEQIERELDRLTKLEQKLRVVADFEEVIEKFGRSEEFRRVIQEQIVETEGLLSFYQRTFQGSGYESVDARCYPYELPTNNEKFDGEPLSMKRKSFDVTSADNIVYFDIKGSFAEQTFFVQLLNDNDIVPFNTTISLQRDRKKWLIRVNALHRTVSSLDVDGPVWLRWSNFDVEMGLGAFSGNSVLKWTSKNTVVVRKIVVGSTDGIRVSLYPQGMKSLYDINCPIPLLSVGCHGTYRNPCAPGTTCLNGRCVKKCNSDDDPHDDVTGSCLWDEVGIPPGHHCKESSHCAADRECKNNVCRLLHCIKDGIWPVTTAGDVQLYTCSYPYVGVKERTCDKFGTWSPVNGTCQRAYCKEDGSWGETPPNTVAIASDRIRLCSYTGSQVQWENEVTFPDSFSGDTKVGSAGGVAAGNSHNIIIAAVLGWVMFLIIIVVVGVTIYRRWQKKGSRFSNDTNVYEDNNIHLMNRSSDRYKSTDSVQSEECLYEVSRTNFQGDVNPKSNARDSLADDNIYVSPYEKNAYQCGNDFSTPSLLSVQSSNEQKLQGTASERNSKFSVNLPTHVSSSNIDENTYMDTSEYGSNYLCPDDVNGPPPEGSNRMSVARRSISRSTKPATADSYENTYVETSDYGDNYLCSDDVNFPPPHLRPTPSTGVHVDSNTYVCPNDNDVYLDPSRSDDFNNPETEDSNLYIEPSNQNRYASHVSADDNLYVECDYGRKEATLDSSKQNQDDDLYLAMDE